MQDAAEPATPPAFPEWLKRMFPTLRAEETNMLFQAFRERRLRRRGGWVASWLPSNSGQTWLTVIIAASVFTYAWSLSNPVSITYAIYVLVIASVVGRSWDWVRVHRFGQTPSSTLPYNVHEVFGRQASADSAAVDLWLAGTNPRDIIEAMYLELYAERWRAVTVGFLVMVVAISIYLCEDAGPPAFWLVLPAISIALAGFYCWKFALLRLHHHVFRSILDKGLLRWTRPYFEDDGFVDVALERRRLDRLGEREKYMPSLAPVGCGVVIPFLVFQAFNYSSNYSQSWLEAAGIDIRLVQLAWPVALAIALCFGMMYHRGRASLAGEIDFFAEHGAENYRAFMRRLAEHASSSPAGTNT
jgi:hypothetical protein